LWAERAYTHIHSGTPKSHLEGFLEKSKTINVWRKERQKPRHVEREKDEHERMKIKGKGKCG